MCNILQVDNVCLIQIANSFKCVLWQKKTFSRLFMQASCCEGSARFYVVRLAWRGDAHLWSYPDQCCIGGLSKWVMVGGGEILGVCACNSPGVSRVSM